MFKLFGKKRVGDIETHLLLKIFEKLPDEFEHFRRQVAEGLITKASFSDSPIPNTLDFSYDVKLLNKYEAKGDRCFYLKGIEVFDSSINDWSEVIIECGYGILMGYSTPKSKHFQPDATKIRLNNFRIEYLDGGALKIMKEFLAESEIALINPSEFYEVPLQGRRYFHVLDLEDGDFIGIDRDRNVYHITHDPFAIKLLDGSIRENLSKY